MSTTAPKALDIRPLPADRKLPTVLSVFGALESGESFVLVDDQDPTPLRTRIEDVRPEEPQWVALETGPPVWAVRVGRRSSSDEAE